MEFRGKNDNNKRINDKQQVNKNEKLNKNKKVPKLNFRKIKLAKLDYTKK